MNAHSTVRKQFFRYVSQNILGMIGVSAYILADTFFIAQAQGADGIAALNLVLPVYSLIFALGAMLATGAATRFALERHEGKHADGYLAEALTWAGILSVPFILLGIFSAEGIVRLVIFFSYLALVSRMKDIQRTFMYHGAEHKCINCIEHGLELNVENVRISSREHKRCGTSFLFIVMFISIVFIMVFSIPLFMVIHVNTSFWRIVLRLLLLPLIAGVSYEFIRLAGTSESQIVSILSRPGMMLQHLTTKEPDDSMIEVAIASVEAVFDWKKFENEQFGTHYELDQPKEDAEKEANAVPEVTASRA